MDSAAIDRYFQDTKRIAGWVSYFDAAIFLILLSYDQPKSNAGNVLEIGVFEGKSTVLLGQNLTVGDEFHVCDIFDGETDTKNELEIQTSYPGLSREKFEHNMMSVLGTLPIIHQCQSNKLKSILGNKVFRFIHIDGSHLYHHVIEDLRYASETVIQDVGVIAVDDFRAQHTIGVAAAVWEIIIAGDLVPFAITPAKMYLVKPNSIIDLDHFRKNLIHFEISWVEEEFLGHKVIRAMGATDENLYLKEGKLKSFLPPVFTRLIQNSYLWRKFRTL
jgi:hypothetical protein